MTVWRAQISYDGTAFTPDVADGTTFVPTIAGRCLIAVDQQGFYYAVRSVLSFTTDPVTFVTTYQSIYDGGVQEGFDDVQQPFLLTRDFGQGWQAEAGQQASAGTTAFLASATLAIEKDGPGDALRFITPAGTLSTTLSGLPDSGRQNDTMLIPERLDQFLGRFTAVQGQPFVGFADAVTRWHDVQVYENGVLILQSPMSQDQPVSFGPGFPAASPAPLVQESNGQELSRYRTELTYPGTGFQNPAVWNDPFSGLTMTTKIDAVPVPAHREILSIWSPAGSGIQLRTSYDNDHSLLNTPVVPAGAVASFSIQTYAGTAVVVYFDGSQIQQTISRDLGASWSSPMPVSITGTNPRLVIGQAGEFFYFYCAGGNINLQRSFDFGATLFDASPLVVAAAVPAQDMGATIGADRTLVVSYIVGGNWTAVKSSDYGLSWSPA